MKLHYIIAPISKDNFCMHGCNDENTIFYLAYIETYFVSWYLRIEIWYP